MAHRKYHKSKKHEQSGEDSGDIFVQGMASLVERDVPKVNAKKLQELVSRVNASNIDDDKTKLSLDEAVSLAARIMAKPGEDEKSGLNTTCDDMLGGDESKMLLAINKIAASVGAVSDLRYYKLLASAVASDNADLKKISIAEYTSEVKKKILSKMEQSEGFGDLISSEVSLEDQLSDRARAVVNKEAERIAVKYEQDIEKAIKGDKNLQNALAGLPDVDMSIVSGLSPAAICRDNINKRMIMVGAVKI